MLNVLLVTNVPSAYRDLFDALGDDDRVHWEVFFAQPKARPDQERALPQRVPWSVARFGRFLGTVSALAKRRPQSVVVGGAGVQMAACLLYSSLTSASLGVWWGGTPRSEDQRSVWRHSLRRWLFARVSFFLCYGPEAAQYLEGLGIPRERLDAFHATATAARSRREDIRRKRGLEEPVILSVGRLDPDKNHARLLRAFLRMRAALGSGSLVLVGDGSLRGELTSEHVALLPRVQWQEMPELYGIADVYVHPAVRDLWPQAVSEALASGTPLVASTQSGFAGFLRDEREALLVDGDSTDALTSALVRLAQSPDLRSRLAQAGRLVVAPLGARNMARRMTDVVLVSKRGD
jgi:glycosyltransferase involved in cell wall biosynthesis